MKKLIPIDSCLECRYHQKYNPEYGVRPLIYCNKKSKVIKIQEKIVDDIDFPSWCPLIDVKEVDKVPDRSIPDKGHESFRRSGQ